MKPVPDIRAARTVGNGLYLAVLVLWIIHSLALHRALRETSPAAALFGSAALVLGLGMLAVIPQLCHREIGVIAGLVGVAGGIGGFYLPTVLGSLQETTGRFGPSFAVFACTAVMGLVLLRVAESRLTAGVPRRTNGRRSQWRAPHSELRLGPPDGGARGSRHGHSNATMHRKRSEDDSLISAERPRHVCAW